MILSEHVLLHTFYSDLTSVQRRNHIKVPFFARRQRLVNLSSEIFTHVS